MFKKVLVVGDGGTGKTSLLLSATRGEFPKFTSPSILDAFSMTMSIEDSDAEVELNIWELPGEEEYDTFRITMYSGVDIVIICYSIDYPDSLENVKYRWGVEAKNYTNGIPIVLVGTKLDLRNNSHVLNKLKQIRKTTVSRFDGLQMAGKIGAKFYFECSSKCLFNVQNIFKRVACELTKLERSFYIVNQNDNI